MGLVTDGYTRGKGGYYKQSDRSGPYHIDGSGVATLRKAASALPSVDYFASDAAMTGWYPNATHPSSIKIGNRTFLGFQRWNYSTGLLKNSGIIYNNVTKLYGSVWDIGDTSSSTDDHGVPSFCIDADGYIHSFGGGHNEPMRHWVTSLPDDGISDPVWVRQPDIGTSYSYPKPVFVAATGQIYLILRKSLATTEPLVVVPSTSIVAGVVTWGAEQLLVDFGNGYGGSGSRVYSCNFAVRGNEIHVPIVFAPHDDSYRQDVYYIIYDVSDGKVYTYDRGFNTAVASLPVLLTSMNTNYRIVNQSLGTADLNSEGQIVHLVMHANGDREVIYLDGLASSSVRTVNVIPIISNVLGSPTQIATTDTTCVHVAGRDMADGSLEVWYNKTASDAGGNVYVTGGDQWRRVRNAGGTWLAETLIRAAGKVFSLGAANVVYGGSDDCGVLFCENIGSATTGIENGRALRCYAYNSSGQPVLRPWTACTQSAAYFAAMTVQETPAKQAILDNFIRNLVSMGAWTNIEAMSLQALATVQAATLDATLRHTFAVQGSMAFVAGVGFAPDAVNDGLDFGFNPSSTGGLLISQNDVLLACYSLDITQSASPLIGSLAAAAPQLSIVPRNTSDQMTARMNDGTSMVASTTNGRRFFAAKRDGATSKKFYRNATETTIATASTGVSNGNVAMFRSSTLFTDRRGPIGIVGKGTGFTRDMTYALGHFCERLVEDWGLYA